MKQNSQAVPARNRKSKKKNKPPLVQCSRHGLGPGYVVCFHILENHAPVDHWERATEMQLGGATCSACSRASETGDLEPEDFHLVCAGCFAQFLPDMTFPLAKPEPTE